MYSNFEELQDRISAIANLPTLPDVASKLMKLVDCSDTSADMIAALVAQDISLSAKVLRLANSAFYGIPRTINTLRSAVVVLGSKIIHTMVLSLTVFDMFGKNDELPVVFDRSAFWQHSLKCGVAARLLAQMQRKNISLDPEEAFCAGLLHDVGKIVMEQYLHMDFHMALHHAGESGISIFEAEKEVLGYTHCDVASWLTGNWSLPDEIMMPLIYHHEPDEAESCADAAMLCHIANILSSSGDNYDEYELETKIKAFGLTKKDLTDIIQMIPREMKRASEFIVK
ncbi:MAG: HDOD domain-containing protein [Chitinispirillales bacterium]|jgi:HD-like signal output (HDOD) protein|nr:HDOD domain-containing protein [Chitinispirillales bacterium]